MKPGILMFSIMFALLNPSAMATQNHKDSMAHVLSQYLVIQQSLAADSLDHVAAAAKEIEKLATVTDLKSAARNLEGDAKIADAREHFKKLSSSLVAWTKKNKPKGVIRVTCPMAKASWVQKSGDIKNPYYGKEMLDCGMLDD